MTRLSVLLLAIAHASSMEMRETVERMVMVRTTGSDLQPAATGYIYKKEGDGPESVVKMQEDEVMEHLSNYYKQPESFAAPIPAAVGPFADDQKSASYTKEHIIPVEEKSEENNDEQDGHIDGIAEVDYDKIFKSYGFGKYNDDFADYLHDLGYFNHGLYKKGNEHGSKSHDDYGDKGYNGYAKEHHYDKGGAGDYHTEKYESYSISSKGGHNKGYDGEDSHGKHYSKGDGYKGGDHGHKSGHEKDEAVDGFHKLFNKDEYKKDHDVYDEEKENGNFHKHGDQHEYHGSDAAGHEKGGEYQAQHDKGDFGKGGYVNGQSGDEKHGDHDKGEGSGSSYHHHRDFGTKGGKFDGKAYGYEVKH